MNLSSSLYGARPPKRKATKEISSSTTLSFTSQLSSLISKSDPTTSTTTSARPRPPKSVSKSDIFTSHNKGSAKRAAADLRQDDEKTTIEQVHKSNIGEVDATVLHRSKRKMEEKARLYAAMKRGDYVPPSGDTSRDERNTALVDFDRKWAENDDKDDEGDNSSGNDTEEEEEELVEYEDEFGRLRRGTRGEAAREDRRRQAGAFAATEAASDAARPAMPSNLIYGDTIQSSAFNPDDVTTSAMETLARKRDRSATPENTHYDASAEVRSKGVGFFQFSKDEGGRKEEMERLEKERKDTEKRRAEVEERKSKRRKEVEERRRVIGEKRAGRMAEGFLEGLGREMG
jgi:hypothetical protein